MCCSSLRLKLELSDPVNMSQNSWSRQSYDTLTNCIWNTSLLPFWNIICDFRSSNLIHQRVLLPHEFYWTCCIRTSYVYVCPCIISDVARLLRKNDTCVAEIGCKCFWSTCVGFTKVEYDRLAKRTFIIFGTGWSICEFDNNINGYCGFSMDIFYDEFDFVLWSCCIMLSRCKVLSCQTFWCHLSKHIIVWF